MSLFYALAAGEGSSVLTNAWNYFYDNFINSTREYEILNVNSAISLQWIIIGVFIGLAVAAVVSVVGKRMNGRFIEKVIGVGCLSPDSAKTLPELDYADKLFIRYAVKHGVNVRRVLRCREEEKYERENEQRAEKYAEMRLQNPKLPKHFSPKPFKINPDSHHFYIPAENKYMAEVKFDKKGTSLKMMVISLVFIAIGLVAVLLCLPSILNLIDGFLGGFKS